ncbi:MAG: 50S ribosomal protein L21 [Dehalococcoidia bacterium]|nr:50S ribosomal protein L21 [Dehalococcoidia bacterium]
MYAVIETGGKQIRVAPGDTFNAELLVAAPGDTVVLDRVLLISDENGVTVGSPAIEGAKVLATAIGDIRAKKVIVFKYKSKTRYRKKTGHRQEYTRLQVKDIVAPHITNGKAKSHGS